MAGVIDILTLKPLRDRLSGSRKKVNTEYAAGGGGKSTQVPNVPEFGTGRTSIPTFLNGGGGVGGNMPKRTYTQLGLDPRTINTSSVETMMDILIDSHPDLSFALWNFLRIGNCDYTITVTKPDSDQPFTQGQKLVDQFIHMLELPNPQAFEPSRSLRKIANQMMMSVLTRGACACELVLAPSLTGVAFIAPVDPSTIVFKYENGRLVPYQNFGGLSLDIPTFFYETLDARIDDPYGRSPLWASIQTIMFQLQILQDIRQVVHNQGYPRFDIKIIEEVLLQRMPISIRNNEEKKAEWLKEKLNEIIQMYNNLQPDDTFVHFDSIEIGMAGGKGNGGGALIDPEKLMTVIDNQLMAGLKTLSTILGRRSTGNTESFAKMEIKLYLQGVRSVQEVVERCISRALTLMLNMTGKQGIVKFKYKPVEIRTELEQAQFEQIALFNYAYMRDQGWIDQVEAANRAVGHDPVGEPNFDVLARGTPNPATGGNTTSGGGSTGTSSGGSTGGGSGTTGTSSGQKDEKASAN